jgi:N6-L-threonylcarbamoyladenine synthase/protein kinase Bud32
MIAVLGAEMHAAGDHLAIEESRVRPEFRPDEVPVTWRSAEPVGRGTRAGTDSEVRGAEALVSIGERVTKERQPRRYRHPTLDERLRKERTASEARLTSEARRHGVPTPVVHDVDPAEGRLVFERVGARDLRAALTESRVRDVGRHLAHIHEAGFVHGDPTPRNARMPESEDGHTHLIDFGLGYYTDDVEDYAMDLHVFEQALAGTADDAERLREAFEAAYAEAGTERVLDQLRAIEGRGRYR